MLQHKVCGEETVSAMLKTTKRFLGQQRFERLSKVFWCENFATDGESKPERRSASLQHQPWLLTSSCGFAGGCLYDTPSGGAEDAVLWPGEMLLCP